MTLHRHRSITLSALIAVVSAVAFSAFAEPQEGRPSTIIGAATVTDGDTIFVGGTKVRLNGFDTPEKDSMCGSTNVYEQASAALSEFIGSEEVTCELSGEKSYDRLIGTCSARGTDFGTFMVESGWGRDWKRFSEGKYASAEKAARAEKRGLWGLACGEDLWGSRNYD